MHTMGCITLPAPVAIPVVDLWLVWGHCSSDAVTRSHNFVFI